MHHVNSFGFESHDHMMPDFLTTCFLNKGLVDVVECLHFSKECPANHNVRWTDAFEVYEDGRWTARNPEETLTALLHSGFRILHKHGRTNKNAMLADGCMDETDYHESMLWLHDVYDNRRSLQTSLKKDLRTLLAKHRSAHG